jgi:Na+/H+ antiporter NhaC
MVESKFEKNDTVGKASYLVVPMLGIIFITLGLLYYTGEGDLRRGSGSFSVLWAVVTSYLILILMLLKDKVFSGKEVITHSIKGIKNLVPAVMVLVLSFAFGDAVKAFGTGTYVSGLMSSEVSLLWIAPLLFITAGIMAFATGTSWGTFAILFPIALPIALQTGIEPAFLLAAVLGGGVFGDHASPISDSTIVASIASGCDHIEHVKTQLPYCLAIAAFSLLLYVVVGSFII